MVFEAKTPRRLSGGGVVLGSCALLALMGILGGFLAPIWLPLDILSHFRLHFAVVAVACMAALWARNRRFTAFTLVAIIGGAAISFWPGYPATPDVGRAIGDPGRTLVRVMTFNTAVSADNWRDIVAVLRRARPDIVVLLELTGRKLPLFDALLQDYPYANHCRPLSGANRKCTLALLSRFPFSHWSAHAAGRRPGFIQARFGPELASLTLIGLHSLRPPDFQGQRRQMSTMNAYLRTIDGPMIVMGDFNATPFSHMLKVFEADLPLRRITNLPSWPTTRFTPPQLAIDHIYISDELFLAEAARTQNHAGSDHAPIMAGIALP